MEAEKNMAEKCDIKAMFIIHCLDAQAQGNMLDSHILIQRVCEELTDECNMKYNMKQVMTCLNELLRNDTLYRVSTQKGFKIGVTGGIN